MSQHLAWDSLQHAEQAPFRRPLTSALGFWEVAQTYAFGGLFPRLAPHHQCPGLFPARGFLHRKRCGAITATCPESLDPMLGGLSPYCYGTSAPGSRPSSWTKCLLFVTHKHNQCKKKITFPFDSSDNKLLKKKNNYIYIYIKKAFYLQSFL